MKSEPNSSNVKRPPCGRFCGYVFLLLAWLALSAAQAQTTNYTLGTTALLEGPSAGIDSVVLGVAPPTGAWTATANDAWLHLNESGIGSTNVIFSYDVNPGATRTGTLTIAGQTLTVTQAGSTYVQAGAVTALVSSGVVYPYDVAVDASKNVYFTDTGNSALKEWIPTNNTVTTLVSSGLNNPFGVAVDTKGNVYIADGHNKALKEWMSANGNVVTLVSNEFIFPNGVAVDSAGNAYFSDGVYDAIDEWVAADSNMVTLVSSGLTIPNGVAVDIAGNVYITDGNRNFLEEWMPNNGNLTKLVSSGLHMPYYVAVDGSGNIYVADSFTQAIKEWNAASESVVTLVSSGLTYPNGVTVDGTKNVYIADSGNNAIKELPYAFVDPSPKLETAAAGNDALPVVLPATENLLSPFAPGSDQLWLTITGITNDVVSFAYTANTSASNRTGNITLFGQAVSVTQSPKVTPAVIWANPVPVIYGTALTSNQLNAAVNLAGAFAYTPTNGAVLNAGTNTLSVIFTPSDTGDYTSAFGTVSLIVSPASLTVTANNQIKTYGQNVTFTGTEFVTGGLVNGDTVTSVTLASSGTGAMAQVSGSPYKIAPSTAVGTFPAGNYTITYVTGQLAVNPAALTITASPENKTYGQTVVFGSGSTLFSGSGLQNGETIGSVTLSVSGNGGAATAPVSGSPYIITPSAATGGTFTADNYAIMYGAGSLTVGQAAPVIIWTNPSPIIYGTTLTTNQLDASANIPSAFTYIPTNGSVLNVGTNALSVLLTPTDTIDYSNATEAVTLVVLPAPLTVMASNTSRLYGSANPVFTGTIIGLTNSDDISATFSCGAVASSPVGTYPIVASLMDPSDRQTNYAVSLDDGTLTVGQATPIVTWTNPAPVIYGAALTFQQLDAAVNVPGSLAYSPTNGTVLNAGTNTLSVTFTPADSVDYQSVIAVTSLIVLPAPLTVTASNASRLYGATNPVFTGTITGLTNGDDITAMFSCSAGANSSVGMYPIVPSLLDPANLETNYAVTLIDGTLTVTPAIPFISVQPTNQAVVLAGNASFTVGATGGTPMIYEWQFNGANLATATNTYLTFSAVASSNAGSYDVVITNSFGSITSATVTLSVLGVPVSFVTNSGGIQFSNGQLQLSLSGLTGQGSVLIEASTNLTQWTPVFTNPAGFGTIQFVDPATTNYQNRYYRVTTPAP